MSNIRVKNRQQFTQALQNLSLRLGEEVVRGSHEAGLMLEGKIKQEWPVDTGTSGREIVTDTNIKNGVVTTTVGSSVKAPWALIVEEGRKPNSSLPNLGAISKFLARKKSLQSLLKGIKKTQYDRATFHRVPFKPVKTIQVQDSFDSLNSDQKGMVFVLARSIARKGIKGKFIFKKTREKFLSKANEIIAQRLVKFLSQ